jgi:LuxR family maltose regulon positive regulatory protein
MSTPDAGSERLTLLRTKLRQPQVRADPVRRLHLLQRPNRRPDRKPTLVSAPAGRGESTLVTGWLAETGEAAAWISLDEGDNDPVRFPTCVIAAIRPSPREWTLALEEVPMPVLPV